MISCVRHGEVDEENMLALCGTCWTWRKLPPDYFPPLINELVCSKENQGHCLSGNVSYNSVPTTFSLLSYREYIIVEFLRSLTKQKKKIIC